MSQYRKTITALSTYIIVLATVQNEKEDFARYVHTCLCSFIVLFKYKRGRAVFQKHRGFNTSCDARRSNALYFSDLNNFFPEVVNILISQLLTILDTICSTIPPPLTNVSNNMHQYTLLISIKRNRQVAHRRDDLEVWGELVSKKG